MTTGWNRAAFFLGGLLLGTAGIKILTSKDAKKAYTQTTAAVLRCRDQVMRDVELVQENCADILADARAINEERAAAADAETIVVEDLADQPV